MRKEGYKRPKPLLCLSNPTYTFQIELLLSDQVDWPDTHPEKQTKQTTTHE